MKDGRSRDDSLDEIVSVMMTPKTSKKLHFPPEVRVLSTQVTSKQFRDLNCDNSAQLIAKYLFNNLL